MALSPCRTVTLHLRVASLSRMTWQFRMAKEHVSPNAKVSILKKGCLKCQVLHIRKPVCLHEPSALSRVTEGLKLIRR